MGCPPAVVHGLWGSAMHGAGQRPAVVAAMQSPGQLSLTLTATVPSTRFQRHLHACVLLQQQQDGEDHSHSLDCPLRAAYPLSQAHMLLQAAAGPHKHFISKYLHPAHASCLLYLCLCRCSMMRERSWL